MYAVNINETVVEGVRESNANTAERPGAGAYTVRLLQRREIAEETMAFDLSRPAGFHFRAGQAVMLTLTNLPATVVKGNQRTFSIASAPSEAHLRVATRMRDSAFKRALREMPLLSALQLVGPTGSFTLDRENTSPAILIAGGIGITPFISMIEDLTCTGSLRPMLLLYSNRAPSSSAFLDELHAWAEINPCFRFVPTMSGTDSELRNWPGERGVIDGSLLRRHVAEPAKASYYIAGPGKMVAAMQDLVTDLGVAEEQIHTDQFFGY